MPSGEIPFTKEKREYSRDNVFQAGGSLPFDSPVYVERKADHDIIRYIKRDRFCYVLAARQMGKSSLKIKTTKKLIDEGWVCISIDISRIGSSSDSDRWLFSFCDVIAKQFGLSKDFNKWWKSQPGLTPQLRMGRFWEEFVLEATPKNVAIFLDEIDSLFAIKNKEFSISDFFASIRATYNKSAEAQGLGLERLHFCIIGVAAPNDLINDPNRTPLNIGKGIKLSPIPLKDNEAFKEGLDCLDRPGDEILEEIIEWTGGQPYLAQNICQELIYRNSSDVRSIVKDLYLSSNQINSDGNLYNIHIRIIHDEKRIGGLLSVYRDLLIGNSVELDNKVPEHVYLQLSGLVREDDKYLKIYNPIYERVFDVKWFFKVWEEAYGSGQRSVDKKMNDWYLNEKKPEYLLNKDELKNAQSWVQKQKGHNSGYAEFISQSQIAQEKKNRKRFYGIMAFLAAVIVGIVTFSSIVISNDKKTQAELVGEIKDISQNIEKLVAKLNQKEEEARSLKNQIQAKEDTIQDLEIELAELTFEVNEKGELADQKNRELEEKNRTINRYSEDISRRKNEIARLRKRLANVDSTSLGELAENYSEITKYIAKIKTESIDLSTSDLVAAAKRGNIQEINQILSSIKESNDTLVKYNIKPISLSDIGRRAALQSAFVLHLQGEKEESKRIINSLNQLYPDYSISYNRKGDIDNWAIPNEKDSKTKSHLKEIKTNFIPELKPVGGGEFLLGAQNVAELNPKAVGLVKKAQDDDIKAERRVKLSDFEIGKWEVNRYQYAMYLKSIGSPRGTIAWPLDSKDGIRPQVKVSWVEAAEYCNWLSKVKGYDTVYVRSGGAYRINRNANGYRLPTESEWEYAAAGGKKGIDRNGRPRYIWSGYNQPDDAPNYSNYKVEGSPEKAKVKSHKNYSSNPLGLYHMSGNVWEWCQDTYSKDSYNQDNGQPILVNPLFTNTGNKNAQNAKVVRGGSIFNELGEQTIFHRGEFTYNERSSYLGFRVARSLK